MARTGLTVGRIASAAWVGAAALFVVTAVQEVQNPAFDAMTKDELALLRFPAYYAFGFALVIAALLGTTAALIRPRGRRHRRMTVAAAVLAVALVAMVIDFLSIYRPMVAMITPPGRAHPAEFQSLHRASMWVNIFHVGMCGLASVLLSSVEIHDKTIRSDRRPPDETAPAA